MGKRRGLIYGILVPIALFAVWLAGVMLTPYRAFNEAGIFVDIPRGTGTRGITRILAERGVVRHAFTFELLSRWQGRTLQAGEYFFDRPMTPLEVHRKLAEGQVFVYWVTIPEGATIFDIGQILERAGLATPEEFRAVVADASPVRDIAPRARNLEGFLFPDTYQFPRRATPQEIVAAMVRRFREVWQSFPEAERNPHRLAPAELITLASLVERETGLADERPIIAGVFYNRLQKGIPLQCDPTVIYALQLANKYKGPLGRARHRQLTTRDLRFASAYNTYLHGGLPPGPIANPGKASLRAALFPPRVDYLYFVADARGGHFFSKTLAEHNANVARYRRLQEGSGAGGSAGLATGGSRTPR